MLAIGLNPSSALAHEGHDEAGEAAEATHVASAELPRLVHSSPRLESVALIDAQGLSIWIDDYQSNRPLQGLAVSVQLADTRLQTQEVEPGLYRLPLDLLGSGRIKLGIAISGGSEATAFEETFDGELPIPLAGQERPQGDAILWIGAALAMLLIGGLLLLGLRARRRRLASSAR